MAFDINVPRSVTEAVLESQTKMAAQLSLSNVGNEEIAKKLGITVHAVRKLQEKEDYKVAIRDQADEMVRVAANTWRSSMNRLIPKALSVLEKNLDMGKLDAVKVILSSIGLDKVEQTPQGGTLQVILPDYTKKEPKDVEIKAER